MISLSKIFSKKSIAYFIVFVFIFLCHFQTVSAKSYYYDLVDVKINVNQDSTFDVVEEQVFNYSGQYHDAWRSIDLNKIDKISDIEVVDGETGQPLIFSSKKLEKLDPASWGYFTYYKQNGFQNIIWYYNLSDTNHKWVIRYKVHGGIGFFDDFDEFYWNIFTDYDAPVKEATAKLTLPEEVDYSTVKFNAYRTDSHQAFFMNKTPLSDKKSFLFEAKNFKPKEDFTIQVSWPKGIVSQAAYWQDFFMIYLLYVLAGLIDYSLRSCRRTLLESLKTYRFSSIMWA